MHIKEVRATNLGQALNETTQVFSIACTFGLSQQISFKMEQSASEMYKAIPFWL